MKYQTVEGAGVFAGAVQAAAGGVQGQLAGAVRRRAVRRAFLPMGRYADAAAL